MAENCVSPLKGKVRDASIREIEVAEVRTQTKHSEYLHSKKPCVWCVCGVCGVCVCVCRVNSILDINSVDFLNIKRLSSNKNM